LIILAPISTFIFSTFVNLKICYAGREKITGLAEDAEGKRRELFKGKKACHRE
jgi:hypothetical protein